MAELLDLSADEVLRTTRAVRKRLDFDRPVPDDVIRELVATSLQAPSGSNQITMTFVIIRDQAKKQAVADLYAECWQMYTQLPIFAGAIKRDTDELQAQQERVADSATFLSEHMAEAPVLVIGCNRGPRPKDTPGLCSPGAAGNVLPAMWSFMLAARARGLGTAWTTLHLIKEREVAEVLGIPYDTVQQFVLSPLAYTKGTDFKPAMRPDPDTVIAWDGWT
jgi:nitroreductase